MRGAEARNIPSARLFFQVATAPRCQTATDMPRAAFSPLTAGSDFKMAMEMAVLVGMAASIASVSSFAPQAWKLIRTRDTRSISAAMYWLTVVGFGLWLTYGIMLGQWPLIVTNAICFGLATFILVMKLLPPSGKQAVAEAIDHDSQDG